MKITIYALHLGVGGVEKYVATLANMLANIGNVSIVVTYKLANEPAFYIDPRVKIEYLIADKTPNKDKIKEAIVNKSAISLIRFWSCTKYSHNFNHNSLSLSFSDKINFCHSFSVSS